MKSVLVSLTIVVLLVFLLRTSSAQAEDWQNLIHQADSLLKMWNVDSATDLAEIALEQVRSSFEQSDTAVASVLYVLGECYRYKGDYDRADSLLEASLRIREKALGPEHPAVALSLHGLALSRMEYGRDKRESLLKRALQIMEESFGLSHPNVAKILNTLGVYYRLGHLSDPEKCEEYHRRALRIQEATLDSLDPDIASSLNNLGILRREQGHYVEAEQYYRKALNIRRKALGPDHPDVAQSLRCLGILSCDLCQYSEAAKLLEQALMIIEKVVGPNHPLTASYLNGLAVVYYEQGRYAEAESLSCRSLEVRERLFGRSYGRLLQNLSNLAELYLTLGEYSKAESSLTRAYEIDEEDPYTLQNLGRLCYIQGDYAQAVRFMKLALDVWAPHILGLEHPLVASCYSDLALVCKDLGVWHEADSLGKRAYDGRRQFFRDVFAVLSEKNALRYSRLMKTAGGNYLSILLDSEDGFRESAEEIADVVFSLKGTVSDGVFLRNQIVTSIGDTNARLLADSLHRVRTRLAHFFVTGPQSDDYYQYQKDVTATSDQENRLEEALARKSTRFRRQSKTWDVNVQKVAEALPTNTALVEYLEYNHISARGAVERRYLAVGLSRAHELYAVDLGCAAEIDSAVDWYRSHIQYPEMADDKEYKKIAQQLHTLIWGPIEEKLGDIEEVFIAPDGALNLIAFAGLLDDNGKFLIEKSAIHYLSAGRDLLRIEQRPALGEGLLAMGDPDYNASASMRLSSSFVRDTVLLVDSVMYADPNIWLRCGELDNIKVDALLLSRQEIDSVERIWKEETGQPVITFLGTQATEDNFKKNASNKRAIHLATHGYFISTRNVGKPENTKVQGFFATDAIENPLLLSGLLFAGANLHGSECDSLGIEDGILTAEEVTTLDLEGVDLVVLSACETGLGKIQQSEGVYGLRRAFQMAGAQTVVSALWKVSDQLTAELMTRFYSAKGKDIPLIMQDIALEKLRDLRKEGKSDHPINWGGAFIAVGDWRLQ